ncbi:MAG: hypothetical protein WC086_01015, partial [Dehalococcoidales bacterium]
SPTSLTMSSRGARQCDEGSSPDSLPGYIPIVSENTSPVRVRPFALLRATEGERSGRQGDAQGDRGIRNGEGVVQGHVC